MTTGNTFRIDTMVNGAVGMAYQKALPFLDAAQADNTRRAYTMHWRRWSAWASVMHVDPHGPAPEAVAAYLAEGARQARSLSGLNVALSAIQFGCRSAGTPLDRTHPVIATVMAGIARRLSRPSRRAAPLGMDDLRRLVEAIEGEDIRALRDRAILLVGFFGALRRSEIVSLDMTGSSPVQQTARGLLLHLTGTKTAADTQTIALPRRDDALCPATAVANYITAAGLTAGPLFRAVSKSGKPLDRRLDATSVRHILKTRLEAVELQVPSGERISPHSLRAGFITAAAGAKVPEHVIQRTSRHKSSDVLRSYIRCADPFTGCAAEAL